MPNPAVITCTKDTWVLAALDVTTGTVYKLSSNPGSYLQTIRITGDTAPTNNDDGADLFNESTQENISSTFAIDVYVKANGGEGSIRVDI